jgi:CRISPR-associated protein Csn2
VNVIFPGIDHCFDTTESFVNTVVIENPTLFGNILNDISGQICGYEGKFVVSEHNKVLRTDKTAELLTEFFPFEINRKPLITKIIAKLEQKAIYGDNYAETVELIGRISDYLTKLSLDFSCDINYTKLDIGAIIKASGVMIEDDCDFLCEKIINYIQLVTEFDREKLFITVNLRFFVDDKEAEEFMKTVLGHGFHVILLEGAEHELLRPEKRYIIDRDFCEIC